MLCARIKQQVTSKAGKEARKPKGEKKKKKNNKYAACKPCPRNKSQSTLLLRLLLLLPRWLLTTKLPPYREARKTVGQVRKPHYPPCDDTATQAIDDNDNNTARSSPHPLSCLVVPCRDRLAASHPPPRTKISFPTSVANSHACPPPPHLSTVSSKPYHMIQGDSPPLVPIHLHRHRQQQQQQQKRIHEYQPASTAP